MFPFPSNGKVLSDHTYCVYAPLINKFPFPSNGKVLSDVGRGGNPTDTLSPRFHSLQTGKSFRTNIISPEVVANMITVSIPFKRESPFGPNISIGRFIGKDRDLGFHSLPTGKSFRTSSLNKRKVNAINEWLVSIPFKRESPFGQKYGATTSARGLMVSIPFKRESPFGPHVLRICSAD